MPMEAGAVRIEELLAHAGWVQELASRLVRDPAAADDLTQEVWARALRSPPRERTNLRSWLAATVRTSARALRRGQSRRREHEQRAFVEHAEPSAAELVERAQLHRQLVEQVLALDEPHRAIVLAHWFEGRSIVAIAERHGMTPRVAKARLDEAHEELRRRLDASNGGRAVWLAAFTAWTQMPSAVATGSGFLIGGLAMGTKLSVSLACAAAVILFFAWKGRNQLPTPEAPPGSAAIADVARLESPAVVERSAFPPSTPTSPTSLDAFLDVEVKDKFTRGPLAGVAISVAFDRTERSKFPKLTTQENEQLRQKQYTDADGRGTLAIPSGLQVTLFAEPPQAGVAGLGFDLLPLASGEHRKIAVDLNIALDTHVFVRVLAREDRTPIAGAVASLILHPPFQSGAQDRSKVPQFVTEDVATSDDTGRLDFWVGSWRLMALHLHAKDRAPAYGFPRGHGTPDDPLEVLLGAAASVDVRVEDLAGAPVPAVRIALGGDYQALVDSGIGELPYSLPSGATAWSGVTDADGRCGIDELSPGMTLRPKLEKAGINARGTPDPFTLAPGERRSIVWRLGAVCTLHGRVLDADGKPVAGLELWLKCLSDSSQAPTRKGTSYLFQQYSHSLSDRTATDSAGNYSFKSVAPGVAWVGPACKREQGAAPTSGAFAPIADEVVIPESASTLEHDLRVQPALYVSGRVVDAQGQPLRTLVTMTTAEHATAWIDHSGEDGTFVAGPIAAGSFLLNADGVGELCEAVATEANAGDKDVLLRLLPGASLSATIVDDESGDISKGQIHLFERGSLSMGRFVNRSPDPLQFDFHGIRPGLYDIVGRLSDGRVALVRGVTLASASRMDLVVRVSRGARLVFKCEGKQAWGTFVIHLGESDVVRGSVSRGAMDTEFVPPGHLVIEYWPMNTGTAQRREIDLKAGEERELVFRDDS